MIVMWKFEDQRMPTEAERKHLSRLMYLAFCDLRALAREGRNEQARALAEAFHNVPLLMYNEDFSFQGFRQRLENYQDQYHDTLLLNYLEEWNKLSAEVANTNPGED